MNRMAKAHSSLQIGKIMGNTPDLQVEWRAACHPLSLDQCSATIGCVLEALNGETDPAQLGIPDDHPDAERIRKWAGP